MWKEVGKFLAKSGAPLLGGVLGGPAGAAMGQMVASTITGDPDSDPQSVLTQLTGNSQNVLAAKEIETNHKERLVELKHEGERIAIERAKIDMANTDSARQREVAFIQATGKQDRFMKILACVVAGGYMLLAGVLIFVDFGKMTPVAINLLFNVFGTLGVGFGTVLNYFFGSSSGSKSKDQTLATAKGMQPAKA